MNNEMILKYIVTNNKYNNINDILKEEFNISNRLFVKLINLNKVFLNVKNIDNITKTTLTIIRVVFNLYVYLLIVFLYSE